MLFNNPENRQNLNSIYKRTHSEHPEQIQDDNSKQEFRKSQSQIDVYPKKELILINFPQTQSQHKNKSNNLLDDSHHLPLIPEFRSSEDQNQNIQYLNPEDPSPMSKFPYLQRYSSQQHLTTNHNISTTQHKIDSDLSIHDNFLGTRKITLDQTPSNFVNSELERCSVMSNYSEISYESSLQASALKKAKSQIQSKHKRVTLNIIIIGKIKAFIDKLRASVNIRSEKKLRYIHYRLLNDLASYSEMESEEEMQRNKIIWNRIKRNLELNYDKFFEKVPVIDPFNIYRIISDILQSLIITVILFSYSVFVFFKSDLVHTQEFKVFQFVSMFAFSFDIILNFFTGFYVKGSVEKKHSMIAINYVKTDFLWDIISTVFLYVQQIQSKEMSMENFYNLLTQIFIFCKIVPLKRLYNRLSKMFGMRENSLNILTLLKLMIFVVILAHIVAIMWYQLALWEIAYGEQDTWIQQAELVDEPWWKNYIAAYYWAGATMMTVGTTPYTPIETLFTTIMMFFTCGVFGYVLQAIGMVLQDLNKSREEFQQELNIINKYMRKNAINQDTRDKVREYLEYIYQEGEDTLQNDQENEILEKLSNNLKNDMSRQVSQKLLANFPFLHKNFSQESMKKLIYHVEEIRASPNEILIDDQSDKGFNHSLYLIIKGKVQIYLPNMDESRDSILCVLKKNQFFGQEGFFIGRQIPWTVKALDFCRLYKINRKDFIEIIKSQEQDFETFCQMKDQMKYYQDFKQIELKCYACESTQHTTINCQSTHYIPQRDRILQKYNYSVLQVRNSKEDIERRSKKVHVGMVRKMIQETCEDFQNDEICRNFLINLKEKRQRFLLNNTSSEYDEDEYDSQVDYDDEDDQDYYSEYDHESTTNYGRGRRNGLKKNTNMYMYDDPTYISGYRQSYGLTNLQNQYTDQLDNQSAYQSGYNSNYSKMITRNKQKKLSHLNSFRRKQSRIGTYESQNITGQFSSHYTKNIMGNNIINNNNNYYYEETGAGPSKFRKKSNEEEQPLPKKQNSILRKIPQYAKHSSGNLNYNNNNQGSIINNTNNNNNNNNNNQQNVNSISQVQSGYKSQKSNSPTMRKKKQVNLKPSNEVQSKLGDQSKSIYSENNNNNSQCDDIEEEFFALQSKIGTSQYQKNNSVYSKGPKSPSLKPSSVIQQQPNKNSNVYMFNPQKSIYNPGGSKIHQFNKQQTMKRRESIVYKTQFTAGSQWGEDREVKINKDQDLDVGISSFQYYFPLYNIDNVIKQIKKIKMRQQRKTVKLKKNHPLFKLDSSTVFNQNSQLPSKAPTKKSMNVSKQSILANIPQIQ